MKPVYVILHHSATEDGTTFSWPAIRKYHKSYAYEGQIITREEAMKKVADGYNIKHPWKDVGYHYGIELVEDYYQIVMGRFPYIQGAHCRGMNQKALGVCFVGNFDDQEVPKEQWDLGVRLVRWLCTTFRLDKKNVQGHRDFANKTCPGTMFDVDRFRGELFR